LPGEEKDIQSASLPLNHRFMRLVNGDLAGTLRHCPDATRVPSGGEPGNLGHVTVRAEFARMNELRWVANG